MAKGWVGKAHVGWNLAPVSFPSAETIESLGIGSFVMVEWETVEKCARGSCGYWDSARRRKGERKGKAHL